MASLLLLILTTWALGSLLLVLHHYVPKIGFGAFLMVVGGLTVFVESQIGVYIQPFPGLYLSLGSNMLVPLVVTCVLVIYVVNGSVPARMGILAVLGTALLTVGLILLYRLFLSLPTGGAFNNGETGYGFLELLQGRTTLASLTAFTFDMIVTAVFYQGAKNQFPKLPEWAVVGAALLASLWTDAIIFQLIARFGTADFVTLLPGDVVGKTISALILWPLVAFYLTVIAPKQPSYIGSTNRKTFDLLLSSFAAVRLALVQTTEALEKSEQERREKEAYVHQIFENVNEGFWLSNPNQIHPFYVNPAYERIWGHSAINIYADPLLVVNAIHPEDRERVMSRLGKQMETTAFDIEYRVVRPDESLSWVRERAFMIRDENGVIYRVAGIAEDITERKNQEKDTLELALERDKVKFLRDFIGEASHDLRSPLTAINLKVYQLSRIEDPAKRGLYLQEIETISKRMGQMIEDLLMLTRLENLDEFELTHLNFSQMIQDIYAEVQPIADQKRIRLLLNLTAGEIIIKADANDLRRAFANLVENAINYTPENGEVSILTAQSDQEVIVTIIDTGIGIPQKDQETVFNRFFRAQNARHTNPNGTGLGLAIVKKVMDRHQGRIELRSVEGKGTTFILHLPL